MSTKAISRLRIPLEVKARDDEARTFDGLAAAYSLDLGGDVIHPGAFKRTLDHWRGSGRVLPLIDQHAPQINPTHSVTQHTLGKLLEAEERSEGLWTRFQVAKTRAGDDLLALLKDGMVEGLSIGYAAINPQRDETGVRHLREIRLDEVSVVTAGMNPDALVNLASVKSLLARGGLSAEERRELEEVKEQIERALLEAPPSDEDTSPSGLAPDDPKRLAVEALLRDITLRGLAA